MISKRKAGFRKWLPFYLMALPCIIYFFVNNYLPMGGLIIAFKNYNVQKGILGSDFVGLENFRFLFSTDEAWIITRNTLGYNLFWIFLNMFIGVAVAIFLNEVRTRVAKKFYMSAILLPYLISMVVVSYLAYAYLSEQTGFINAIFKTFGLHTVAWYQNAKYWPFILTIVYEWKNIGFNAITIFASVVGISKDYYEAAEIDGATKWQQIKKITLPMLKPTIVMLITIGMGNVFRSDFGLFYQVPRNVGLLNSATDTIDTFVFRALLQTGDIGMASAASFYQSIVCFITIMVFNGLMRKYSKENAMF